jgi:hypothetical protein
MSNSDEVVTRVDPGSLAIETSSIIDIGVYEFELTISVYSLG